MGSSSRLLTNVGCKLNNKRGKQIERVMGATVGIYGDLQGIAGKSLQEIEGLELKSLGFADEKA